MIRWKTQSRPIGSTRITDCGYRLVKTENGWEREHRVIFRTINGEIPSGFDIHHKDGNKLNNSIENLEMVGHSKHISEHKKGKVSWNKGIKGERSHTSKMFICLECGNVNNIGNLTKHFKLSGHLIRQEF